MQQKLNSTKVIFCNYVAKYCPAKFYKAHVNAGSINFAAEFLL